MRPSADKVARALSLAGSDRGAIELPATVENDAAEDGERTGNMDMKGAEEEGLLGETVSGNTSQAVSRDTTASGAKRKGEYTQS